MIKKQTNKKNNGKMNGDAAQLDLPMGVKKTEQIGEMTVARVVLHAMMPCSI